MKPVVAPLTGAGGRTPAAAGVGAGAGAGACLCAWAAAIRATPRPIVTRKRIRNLRAAYAATLWSRLDPQQGPLFFVRQYVQQAVRTLADVADPLPQIDEQRFAPQFFHFLVEQDPLEVSCTRDLTSPKGAHENVALPLRQLVAGIEGQPGRGDGRHPDHHRRLEAGVSGALRLPRSLIAPAVAHHRPSVVGARLHDVDLVAAVRTILRLPHLARRRMKREAERVPVAVGIDRSEERRVGKECRC